MRYALLIYPGGRTPDEFSGEERRSIETEYQALSDEPRIYSAAGLQPAETATTVRVQAGQTLTTDGPFANTKEVLGGLCLLEADNLDEVLELAARIPAARMGGAVEVRPLMER